jgi:predicted PurR-regulated permease PerM
MSDNTWVRVLVILLVIIAALHLLGQAWTLAMQFGDIITLFFLAWLVAFLLNPVTKLLCSRAKMSRPLAAGVIYLVVFLVILAAGILAVPVLVTQLAELAKAVPGYISGLSEIPTALQDQLRRLGVNADLSVLYRPEGFTAQLQSIASGMAQNAVSLATGVASLFFNTLIVLILSFYLAVDGPKITKKIFRAAPTSLRPEVHYLFDSIDRSFGGFVRGQVVLSVLCTLLTAIIMMLAGLPYVLVVSIYVFVVMLIPFVGPFLALAPPVLIAFLQLPTANAIVVTVALVVLQSTILNVLSPKIMGEALGIHPLIVFLSMLAGAKVAGVGGAVFGVPIAGVINAMVIFVYHRAQNGHAHRIRKQRLTPSPPINIVEVIRQWLPR